MFYRGTRRVRWSLLTDDSSLAGWGGGGAQQQQRSASTIVAQVAVAESPYTSARSSAAPATNDQQGEHQRCALADSAC
eukprot:9471963-Pyramimonas_sp.AAC.1